MQQSVARDARRARRRHVDLWGWRSGEKRVCGRSGRPARGHCRTGRWMRGGPKRGATAAGCDSGRESHHRDVPVDQDGGGRPRGREHGQRSTELLAVVHRHQARRAAQRVLVPRRCAGAPPREDANSDGQHRGQGAKAGVSTTTSRHCEDALVPPGRSRPGSDHLVARRRAPGPGTHDDALLQLQRPTTTGDAPHTGHRGPRPGRVSRDGSV